MPERLPLEDLLAAWLPLTTFPPEGEPIRVGVSGGADSLALLALASAAGCDVTAVHINHGQRGEQAGETDALFVAGAAEHVGAAFEFQRASVEPGSNLEERMRAARYKFLGPEAATGHTADDQAETVLINLLRGTGLVGLGAMQPGYRRPILALRRADTEAVCTAMAWQPIADPTNDDPAFVRNRVRHELLPLVTDIAGRDVVPLLIRTATHVRSAADALELLAAEIDPTDAKAVAAAPTAVAATALQRWIRAETESDHPIDSAAIARVVAVAKGDASAAEVSGGFRIARTDQILRIEPISPPG